MSDSLWNELNSSENFFLIAGPCVIEDRDTVMGIAARVKGIAELHGIPLIFKASFDKANRSSINSFRGPGLEKGLEILKEVKEEFDLPVLTDIHLPEQAKPVAEVCNIIQIPAFLCRQTDLLVAAGETGKIVNVKKGQFLAPWDMENVVKKIESTGNKKIMLTERGTSFGYNNLVVDFKSFPIMATFGYPVVFDVTHSVQLPGGLGDKTGGQREFIPYLAKAAAACGAVNGFFFEVHEDPEKSKSDAANIYPLNKFGSLLDSMIKIWRASVGNY